MTNREMLDKRAKGLCFTCNDKWSPSHVCQQKELQVLISSELEEWDEEDAEEFLAPKFNGEACTNIALSSVVGLSNPKTMKLLGIINGAQVIIMIDPGATNNFISLSTVHKLNLPYSNLVKFGVTLGNGERVHGEGECKQLRVEVQGLTILEDFLVLELGGADIILGLQWLEKLGETTTNWRQQVMRFDLGNQLVELRGDPSLGVTQISLKAMERILRKEKQGVWVEFNEIQTENKPSPIPPGCLQSLLNKFKSLFLEPKQLPPNRTHDYAIILKEGTNPVSVKPYRYPQIQKMRSKEWSRI